MACTRITTCERPHYKLHGTYNDKWLHRWDHAARLYTYSLATRRTWSKISMKKVSDTSSALIQFCRTEHWQKRSVAITDTTHWKYCSLYNVKVTIWDTIVFKIAYDILKAHIGNCLTMLMPKDQLFGSSVMPFNPFPTTSHLHIAKCIPLMTK